MSQDQKLLPVEEEQKLLPDPAAARSATPREPEKPKPSRKGLFIVVLVALVLVAGVFVAGWLPRVSRTKATEKAAQKQEDMIPAVRVTKVKRSPEVSRLVLPGNTTPLIEAPLYARASGYITKRYVDIGDRVRKDELMAVIEAPDLDQQVAQGRAALSQARQQLGQTEAALEQAQAQLALAKLTSDRYQQLVFKGAVSRQEADTQKTNFETSAAVVTSAKANIRAAQDNVQASQANVDRLISLQSFKEVRAPFNGVVTARNVDVGTYVSPNGGQSGSTTYDQTVALGANSSASSTNAALFSVAQSERLRILINVPQSDAPNVVVGQSADLTVTNYPGRRFTGKVTRTSNSLDPATRTLLVEVQVDNRTGTLLPGMYANVQFSAVRSSPPILVPGDALITRSDGAFLAILTNPDKKQLEQVESENPDLTGEDQQHEKPKRIHLTKVEVGRDFGTVIEILEGLQGWEYVVSNPNDDIVEGALVFPARGQSSGAAPPVAGAKTGAAPGQQH